MYRIVERSYTTSSGVEIKYYIQVKNIDSNHWIDIQYHFTKKEAIRHIDFFRNKCGISFEVTEKTIEY